MAAEVELELSPEEEAAAVEPATAEPEPEPAELPEEEERVAAAEEPPEEELVAEAVELTEPALERARGDTVADRGVGLTVGRGRSRVGALRSDSLTLGPSTQRSVGAGKRTSVSLLEGRGGAVAKDVPTGRVGRITVTLSERVGSVVTGHDPAASHLVKSVLAFIGSRVGRVLRDTDSETELVGSHVATNSQQRVKLARQR